VWPQEEKYKSFFSVDNIIFGYDHSDLKVLLIKRGGEPFLGMWALPGDKVKLDETLDHAALRILDELTGVKDVYLDQVYTFGEIERHPEGRVITIAYYSLINIKDVVLRPDSFAEEVAWKPIGSIENLAFDHQKIMNTCLQRLKQDIKLRPIGFELLPYKFTLTELQRLYEVILDQDLDKRNFRKKILSMNLLKTDHEYQSGVSHRPAKLYTFDAVKYEAAKKTGFVFEL